MRETIMSARAVRWLLCLVLLAGVAAPALSQDFTILKFHADIAVRSDSLFTIAETIEVQFHKKRHGIYREIPFTYRDESRGSEITTPLEVASVTDASGKRGSTRCREKGG
jgi:hypothetical protein